MNGRDDVKYSGVVKQETASSLFLAVTDRGDPGGAKWLSRACYQVGSLGRLTDSTSKSAHIHSQFLEDEKYRENKMNESSASSSGWSQGGIARLQPRPHRLEAVIKGPEMRAAG